MAMMISWVARVNPSHPYLENDPALSFDPAICAFHLGFSLDQTKFSATLDSAAKKAKVRLNKGERLAILSALGERDPDAASCIDDKGNTQPDPDLRDTETVPLKESLESYMAREVLPYAPDAWPDHNKTKIGYEVSLNLQFYVYEPPRPLEDIESSLRMLKSEIADLMAEVTI